LGWLVLESARGRWCCGGRKEGRKRLEGWKVNQPASVLATLFFDDGICM
jgi:hypothetical protein